MCLSASFDDQRPPHVAGFGIAVQQHDGIALAGDEVVQPDAVDLGEFALRRLRERGVESSDATDKAINITDATARRFRSRHCIRYALILR